MASKAQLKANRKYNEKMYTLLAVHLPKDLVVEFRAKCIELGVSQGSVVKKAVENFVNNEN